MQCKGYWQKCGIKINSPFLVQSIVYPAFMDLLLDKKRKYFRHGTRL